MIRVLTISGDVLVVSCAFERVAVLVGTHLVTMSASDVEALLTALLLMREQQREFIAADTEWKRGGK